MDGAAMQAEARAFVAESDIFGGLDDAARDQLAERLEAVAVDGGDVVIREGDPADGLYLVAAGRLQVRIGPDDAPTVIGEVGRGEVVGEAALLTERPRSATVVALRDSLLLRLSFEAFEEVLARSPMVLRPIAGQVVERLRQASAGESSGRPVATIAVVALHEAERCGGFLDLLAAELAPVVADLAVVARADVPAGTSVTTWLNALETDHDLVLFGAGGDREGDDGEWTRRCLRQADVVLLVGDGTRAPALTAVEEVLAEHRRRVPVPVELVLVHPGDLKVPSGTHRWLADRDLRRHHHVREANTGDAARVARLLTGRGIGVVLSGGGARGMAEIGVTRAMGELGIPIDAIGGTSAGSLVAGAFARGWPVEGVTDVMRRGMGRAWRAVRASMSIPGVFPPVAQDGDVLVDGGLVDNLPVAEMRRGHEGITVIAVDVGVHRGLSAGDLPDSTIMNGWRLLVDRVHPRRQSPEVVGILPLLARLTELGGGGDGDEDQGDVTVRPDVEEFAILDFGRFDELVEVGHRDGLATLGPWWERFDGSG